MAASVASCSGGVGGGVGGGVRVSPKKDEFFTDRLESLYVSTVKN